MFPFFIVKSTVLFFFLLQISRQHYNAY